MHSVIISNRSNVAMFKFLAKFVKLNGFTTPGIYFLIFLVSFREESLDNPRLKTCLKESKSYDVLMTVPIILINSMNVVVIDTFSKSSLKQKLSCLSLALLSAH